MKQSLQAYCERFGRAEILEQWHTVRNGDLTPMDVTFGSHRKVWWRCAKGHTWQAIVKSRVERNDCPVCAGKVKLARRNRYRGMEAEKNIRSREERIFE